MIAYVDTSVLLRVVFGEPGRLAEWEELEQGVTSVLARAECLRAIDRLRARAAISDDEVAVRRQAVFALFEHMEAVPLTPSVLERVGDPFPTNLRTLDAIHLATALLWQRANDQRLEFILTHDAQFARAARACGLEVLGA